MDEDDKCMAYGHMPTLTRAFNTKVVNGEVVRSKRRKKMYVCTRCGARDV